MEEKKEKIVVIIRRLIVFFDQHIIFTSFVSFLLAVVAYIMLGSFLEISYLVSISLAVTGGIWSYLSIEQNKVKELRGEYLNHLKDIELSAFEVIESSGELYFELVRMKWINEKEEKRLQGILIAKKWSGFSSKFNLYLYRCFRLKNNKYNFKDIDALVLAGELVSGFFNRFDEDMKNNILGLAVENKDEKDYNFKVTSFIGALNGILSREFIDFDEFSDDYFYKKTICFSIISVCVYTVAIKAIMLQI